MGKAGLPSAGPFVYLAVTRQRGTKPWESRGGLSRIYQKKIVPLGVRGKKSFRWPWSLPIWPERGLKSVSASFGRPVPWGGPPPPTFGRNGGFEGFVAGATHGSLLGRRSGAYG